MPEFANQPLQCRRRVSRTGRTPDLAAQAALGYRHDDPLLVNIKPDIRDMIPHDPSPYA
jgi:hypothetical protein